MALLDDEGMVLERYEYDAYGQPALWDAGYTSERSTSNYDNPCLFTGRRIDFLDDENLTLQYSRNRYYEYDTGRWLTHDPIGNITGPQNSYRIVHFRQYHDGLSLYEYVKSSPVNRFDSSGMQSSNQHKICCEILATSHSIYYNKGKCERKSRYDIKYETIISKHKDQGNANTYAVHDCLCHFSHNSYIAVIDAEYGECNICGPDVTNVLSQIRDKVKEWLEDPKQDKDALCRVWPWEGPDAFEIDYLKDVGEHSNLQGSGCATGKCAGTVEVSGDCFLADAVNYYLWGVMCSLCEDNESQRDFWAHLHLLSPLSNSDPDCSKKWIEAGYIGTIHVAGCDKYKTCKTGSCSEEVRKENFVPEWDGQKIR